MPDFRLSPWCKRALLWWCNFIDAMPEMVRRVDTRDQKSAVLWTDAAGPSRMVAAVMWDPHTDKMYHTFFKAPQGLMDQFLPRRDNMIQVTELLGIILGYATFEEHVHERFVTWYTDNDAVLATLLNGAAAQHAADMNVLIGRFWLAATRDNVAVNLARVPSAMNIADGPTRDNFKWLNVMNSTFVEPRLPRWVQGIWNPLVYEGVDSLLG